MNGFSYRYHTPAQSNDYDIKSSTGLSPTEYPQAFHFSAGPICRPWVISSVAADTSQLGGSNPYLPAEWVTHSRRAFSPEPPFPAGVDSILSAAWTTRVWGTAFHVSSQLRAEAETLPGNLVLLRDCFRALRYPSKNQRSHSGHSRHLPSLPTSPVTTSLLTQTSVSALCLGNGSRIHCSLRAPTHSDHWIWNIRCIVCEDLA